MQYVKLVYDYVVNERFMLRKVSLAESELFGLPGLQVNLIGWISSCCSQLKALSLSLWSSDHMNV